MLYNLRLRLCTQCPASESNTDRESVGNTTSSELVSVYTCILVACGYTSSMCESVISFLNVSSWSLVTVSIIVLIERLLLVCLDNMGRLE